MKYLLEWAIVVSSVVNIGVTFWAHQKCDAQHAATMNAIINIKRSSDRCDACTCGVDCGCVRHDRCNHRCKCGGK